MWPFKKKEEYFKVGDVVKCIDDRDWNLVPQTLKLELGKNYKVLMVVTCPTCGCISLDIGCRFLDSSLYTDCNITHELPGQGIHLAGLFRFEKSNELSIDKEELESELAEAVKTENYEKAVIVRDQLEKIKS